MVVGKLAVGEQDVTEEEEDDEVVFVGLGVELGGIDTDAAVAAGVKELWVDWLLEI